MNFAGVINARLRASARGAWDIIARNAFQSLLLSLASLVSSLLLSCGASADTLDWASRPGTVDLLSTNDVATVNGTTITTSGARSGTVDGTSLLQLQPAGSGNGSPGVIQSQINAATDNESMSQTTTFTFSEPVYNLSFTVIDIDGGPNFDDGTNSWNDVVEFNSNGGLPSAVPASGVTWNAATGRASANQNANITDTTGNITVTFAGPVTSVTVRHIAANVVRASGNPTNQFVYIDDLNYTPSPRVTISKVSNGGVGTFSFTGTNGFTGHNITTATAGAAVAGPTRSLTSQSVSTTLTESAPPAGFALTGISCSGLGSGTATPNLATRSVALSAAAFVPGAAIACTFTNTRATVRVQKTTVGGTGGAFNFSDTNIAGSIAGITTTTANTPTPASPAASNITTIGTAVTITETPIAGYALTAASCTDANSAVTGNTGSIGTLSGNTLTIPAANVVAGVDFTCAFTNTRATIKLQKTTLGGFGGPFSFADTNVAGTFADINTTTANTPAPALPTASNITTVGTAVTITETPPAGNVLTAASCTDANSAVTGNTGAVGTLAGNVLTIPAANVRAGSDFTCVFTNTKTPTVKVQKTTTGGFGGPFSFTQTNLASAPANITTTAVGTPTPASPTAINVTAIGTAVTVTETLAAGFTAMAASCTDANSAITGNTGAIGTFSTSTRVLTIPTANVVAGADFTCVFTNARTPTVKVQKTTAGGFGGPFSFAQTNLASAPGNITTAAGTPTPASPAAINVTTIGTTVTLTETPAAGYALTAASCTDANSAVTGNTGAIGSLSGNTLTIPAGNVNAGADYTCVFTNTRLPAVTITKISNGDIGPFTFNGDNGFGAAQTITTVASGTGVSGATRTLAAASTATTITETIPAGYALTAASCTGIGSGTATPNLSAGTISLDAAATAAGNAIACTFTNTKLPTITITKISNGGVGPFTFNGDNGFGAAQTITTVTSGTGVSGTTRTLAAASTATTITETIPAGYALTAAVCTGIGSGTATPNLSAGTIVLNAAATAAGNAIACTFTNIKLPTITLTKISNGDVGSFTFNGDNGFGAAQTITTVTSGTGVSGATRTLAGASTITTITETIPAGYALTAATCTGIGSGTVTPNLSAGTVTLNAAATSPGNTIACTFTNTKLPTITLTKISNGGVGPFTFNGDNGFGVAQTITTVTSGTGVTGALRTLAAASTATTITETIPAGYVLTAASCTGIGSGTATPNLAAGTIALNAAATAAGNAVACTFTNTKLPTITVTKISNGDVGPFTFNGNNGFGAAQTITTVTSGTGVAGATRTLTAASTATTITETIPAGYALTAATCTGIGSGTATPNLSAGTIALNAAATAAGNNIACTFTNTKLPTITLTKISNGDVGPFTFNGNNGFGAAQTSTTVTSSTGVSGGTRTLAAASTATTITETIPVGYALTAATCAGIGSGTAIPNLAAGIISLNAAATAAGNNIACTFTNTKLPTITVTKISNGGVGAFSFTGNNGFANQTITTVSSGAGVAGATQVLTAASTAASITETSLPGGFVLASISCSGLGSGGSATPNLATATVNLNAAATAPGANIACTFVNGMPGLSVTKTGTLNDGGDGIANAGDTISYSFTIANTGTVTLTNIGASDPGATLTGGPIASLAPGASDSTTITGTHALTQAEIDSGSYANTVTITANPPTGPPILANDTETVTLPSIPTFTVVKVQTAGPNPVASLPATLTYTITVANTGNRTLTAPAISDSLTQGASTLTLTSGPTLSSGDTDSDNALDTAETWIYTATYAVTQANIDDGGDIVNTATFDSAESSPVTSAPATTPITQTPGLTIVKTADTAGPAGVNDVITYTYTIANTGNVTIDGVTVNDVHNGHGTSPAPGSEAILNDQAPLGDSTDAAVNGNWDVLAPGDSITFTSAYTVTQTDVDLLQ